MVMTSVDLNQSTSGFKKFDTESLTRFLTTTHRGLDNPQGMPNPDFMDYQIKQIVAYFLSLYKKDGGPQ